MKPTTRSLIKYRGAECLNCSTPLDVEDKYCHQCGQLNSKKQLALQDFFGEFFSNIFSYDSRIWRTIKHLLFKPGYVSRQFINGKRLSYANPFRFFLSVCIVFFLMVEAQELVKTFTDDQIEKAVSSVQNEGADINIGNGFISADFEDQKNNEQLTDEQLQEIEKKPVVGKYIAKKLQKEQAAAVEADSIATEKSKKELVPNEKILTQKDIDSLGAIDALIEQIDYYQTYYEEHKVIDPATALTEMKHDNTKYNQSIYEKNILLQKISSDPSILVDIILPKLPVFLFLFTPILTLFLWLLYARRDFTYMEHLIFAFNTFTFTFLSMILLYIIKWLSLGYVDLTEFFFWFVGPFYLYKSMRNFYGQNRIKTILKFLLVSFIFVVGLLIGVGFLLLIGIALY
jgi:soluble cytochrome b562